MSQTGIGRTLAHPYSGVIIVNDLHSPTLLSPVLEASLKEPGMIRRGGVRENISNIDCILEEEAASFNKEVQVMCGKDMRWFSTTLFTLFNCDYL